MDNAGLLGKQAAEVKRTAIHFGGQHFQVGRVFQIAFDQKLDPLDPLPVEAPVAVAKSSAGLSGWKSVCARISSTLLWYQTPSAALFTGGSSSCMREDKEDEGSTPTSSQGSKRRGFSKNFRTPGGMPSSTAENCSRRNPAKVPES